MRTNQSCPKVVFVSTSPSAGEVKALNKAMLALVETCSSRSSSAEIPTISQPSQASPNHCRLNPVWTSNAVGCQTNNQKPTVPIANDRLRIFSQRITTPSGATLSSIAEAGLLATATPIPKAKLPSVECPSAAEIGAPDDGIQPVGQTV